MWWCFRRNMKKTQLRINIQKNNKSGFNGVWYRKNRRRWIGEIRNDKGRRVTRQFRTKDEANEWRVEYIKIELKLKPLGPHCYRCKKYKDASEFHKDVTRAHRVSNICKECDKIKQKARYYRRLKP